MFKRVVFYENLASKPKEEVTEMFKLSNIPIEHVSTALEALKKDSQQGILGKQGKARSISVGKDMLATFDEYMKDCGMAQIRHDMTVEEFMAAFD